MKECLKKIELLSELLKYIKGGLPKITVDSFAEKPSKTPTPAPTIPKIQSTPNKPTKMPGIAPKPNKNMNRVVGQIQDKGIRAQAQEQLKVNKSTGQWSLESTNVASDTATEPFGKPFASESQRRWMHANDPKMAEKWEKHTPKDKSLPEKVNNEDDESNQSND